MTNSSLPRSARTSDFQVLAFIVILCFVCAFLLAVVAYVLKDKQQAAKEFDQSKQMLIAAKILNHAGSFEILQEDGTIVPAQFNADKKILIPFENAAAPLKATDEQIKEISALRIRPLVTDEKGNIYTLGEKGLNLPEYLAENKKAGYAALPLKLFYAILPNTEEAVSLTDADVAKDLSKISTFIIPVSGFGLWGPIYGYIAIGNDGDKVIGTTWYEHAETPGLGANIAEPWWQQQFYGKEIFQESPGGAADFKTADLGLIVVKGKVKDVYGTTPKSKSAVDGMSGATLTGDGVTSAYRDSLSPYRPFLIKIHDLHEKKNG